MTDTGTDNKKLSNEEISENLYKKSAELKEKSQKIREKLDATIKECDRLLHPEQKKNTEEG